MKLMNYAISFFIILITISVNIVPDGVADINHVFYKVEPVQKYGVCNKDSYDLLILTLHPFEKHLHRLVSHKNILDITCKLLTLEKIFDGSYLKPCGRDKAEQIKYFLKYAKETWNITYVLLVGGFRQIPVRYCWNNDNYSAYDEPNFISDLYYADIYDENGNFSSWDSDGDGKFGEWDIDGAEDSQIDLQPDICIGRLPCRNIFEVKTVVNKIIQYEQNSYEKSWFKDIVVVGGDDLSNATGNSGKKFWGYESEIFGQMVLEIMSDFNPVKLWVSDKSLDEQGYNVIKSINDGCGFLYIPTHANPAGMVTYQCDTKEAIDIVSNQRNILLWNNNMLPVCMLGGCHTNQFDVTPINFLRGITDSGFKYFHVPTEDDMYLGEFWKFGWVPECIGWRLVDNPHGGAIATIGNTGLGWKSIELDSGFGGSDFLEIQFFKEYQKNETTIGQIWRNCITEYLNNFTIDWNDSYGTVSSINAKTIQQWVLFGDPTLKIGGYDI